MRAIDADPETLKWVAKKLHGYANKYEHPDRPNPCRICEGQILRLIKRIKDRTKTATDIRSDCAASDLSWGEVRNTAESGRELVINLANNGDKVTGCFVGEPYSREVHWTGKCYEECIGGHECASCVYAGCPILRISINFYVPAQRALRVFEGGVVWFRELLKVRDKYGLDEWTFEVERYGGGWGLKTTYTILPDDKLTKGMRTQIEDMETHDLAAVYGDAKSS